MRDTAPRLPCSFLKNFYFNNFGGGLVAKLCPTLCDPMTLAHQAPLSMGFSRREYWSGLPFPSPRDLPHPGIESGSPALKADSLPTEPITLLRYNSHSVKLTTENVLFNDVSKWIQLEDQNYSRVLEYSYHPKMFAVYYHFYPQRQETTDLFSVSVVLRSLEMLSK